MKRIKKQLAVFLGVILCLAAVFTMFLTAGEKEEKREDSSGSETGEMAEEESPQEEEQAQILMEKYGIPENNFIEITVDEAVTQSIDCQVINQLKTYRAVPAYEAEAYMKEMAEFLLGNQEPYEISAEDYEKNTDGEMKGWGDYYRCRDKSGNEFLSGSRYQLSYYTDASMEKKEVANPQEFVEDYIERFHLGLWEGEDNWVQMGEADGVFTGTVYVDGIKLERNLFGNEGHVDDDGARYPGACELSFEFDENNRLCSAEMYSAELSKGQALKRNYQDMDDILKIAGDREWTPDTGVAYHFKEAHLAYNLGICEDGTYLLTPWLLLVGTEDIYYPHEEKWRTHECEVRINLSAGRKYGS